MGRACACPSFSLSFSVTPFTQWHEILSQNTRDSKLSYGVNPKSLSHLVLEWYRVVTPGQIWTDRITIANMCYSYAS